MQSIMMGFALWSWANCAQEILVAGPVDASSVVLRGYIDASRVEKDFVFHHQRLQRHSRYSYDAYPYLDRGPYHDPAVGEEEIYLIISIFDEWKSGYRCNTRSMVRS